MRPYPLRGANDVMTETQEQRLLRAGDLREAGRLREALQEYRGLAETITDTLDRGGVLLNEIACLREAGKIGLAKERLRELKELVSETRGAAADTEDGRRVFLAVTIKFEEAESLLVEGKEKEGLSKLDELLIQYSKHLRVADNRPLYESVQTRRGFLLANLRRCAEAKPILEEACSFENHRGSIHYYLGHCYCALGEMQPAKDKLIEALNLGMPEDLEYRAHCTLGMVYYKLEAYARAKEEFEICAQNADEAYIREADLWKWLAGACRWLGLTSDAERYAKLAKAAK